MRLAVAVGGVNKGQSCRRSRIVVAVGVADIDGFVEAVSLADQLYVFTLCKSCPAGTFVVVKEVPKVRAIEKDLDISCLAVADDVERVFLF